MKRSTEMVFLSVLCLFMLFVRHFFPLALYLRPSPVYTRAQLFQRSGELAEPGGSAAADCRLR